MISPKEIIARNNIQICGEGEKVLLFGHGFGCDQNTWRAIIPAFSVGYKMKPGIVAWMAMRWILSKFVQF
jgi:hypothetical protein